MVDKVFVDPGTKVSIIIPTMNEEGSIGEVLDEIHKAMGSSISYEVLVVDTNSRDKTVEIAREKGARVISEPRRGYGRAYKTGFENAIGGLIVTLDADRTYPACDIPKFVKQLVGEQLDFISCDRLSKLERGVMSIQHRLGNWLLTTTGNLLFGARFRDSQSGMWIFRKSILGEMDLGSDGMSFSEEIKIEAWKRGLRIREVVIDYRVRMGEKKLRSWRDGLKNLVFLFKKRFSTLG